MYVWGRFFKVAVRGFWGRKQSLTDDSLVTFRVWPGDLDFNFHMNNGRYLMLMDVGRLDMLLRAGLGPRLLRGGWRPMMATSTIRYRRPLGLFARYRLRSRMTWWDDKWFYIEQSFERGGEVCAYGVIKGLFRGPEGNISPAEMARAAGIDPTPPDPPAGIEDWQAWETEAVRKISNNNQS